MGPPWDQKFSFLYFIVLLLLLNISKIEAGCYQQRLCCTGRNVSCKTKDDGLSHIPLVTPLPPVKLVKFRGEEYPPVLSEDGQRIGRLILPDVVELDNENLNFEKQFGHAEYFTALDGEEYRRKHTALPPRQQAAKTKTLTQLIFGYPVSDEPTPDNIHYEKGRPIIRLSTLNRYLPVKVGHVVEISPDSFEDEYQHLHEDEYPSFESVRFLVEADPDCFCDELCVQYGDCCSDYTYVCPPTDCQVSQWGEWSKCEAYQTTCGQGRQERKRVVTIPPAHGGMPCLPLVEARACFKECPVVKQKDITTVALLLPYKYHEARKSYRHPKEIIPKRNHTNYCVTYKLGWVNRNCVEKEFKSTLFRGTEICAECQPEAQYHRQTPRCASDLDDGQKGYWKLIGPPSCYGIWYRKERIDNCYCNENPRLKKLAPYLLV
uniref:SMB domain-containing protein n=1 Tax=Panagrolaimus sp. PS1159 TaxID=55785 RepID=A0AC35G243_9BILA